MHTQFDGKNLCSHYELERQRDCLEGRLRNLQKCNEGLKEQLDDLRCKYSEQSDYVRELQKDIRKGKRLKAALNDFMRPQEDTNEIIRVHSPRYDRLTGRWM